jgi:hypothetical protein
VEGANHILSADFDDINAFHTAKKDFKTVFICMFMCFFLYYKRKCRENGGSLSEADGLYTTSLSSSHMLVLMNIL